jgi:hypothetical protein
MNLLFRYIDGEEEPVEASELVTSVYLSQTPDIASRELVTSVYLRALQYAYAVSDTTTIELTTACTVGTLGAEISELVTSVYLSQAPDIASREFVASVYLNSPTYYVLSADPYNDLIVNNGTYTVLVAGDYSTWGGGASMTVGQTFTADTTALITGSLMVSSTKHAVDWLTGGVTFPSPSSPAYLGTSLISLS